MMAKIITPIEDSKQSFEIDKEQIERLLLDPKISDMKVCLVSVAGAFRTGKSFILNFFLRYLLRACSNDQDDANNNDWLSMETEEMELEGFTWRGGDDRCTCGIQIWPEPFILEQNGEEIAVLLMDTQGIFDSASTVKNCATIFALSTLISSVQIYNINKTIQEDHLQHLQLFTEYARLAMDEYGEANPFQTLFFLVRDWYLPYEAEYGIVGGQQILDKRLEVTPRQHPELQQLRMHIKSSFADLKCFLLPHPGLKVAMDPEFRGQLDDIDADFKCQLSTLVQLLFGKGNLVVKSINGRQLTCRELAIYMNTYHDIFRGDQLPEPKTILMATCEANNMAALANAKALYMREMEQECGLNAPHKKPDQLQMEHEGNLAKAIRSFDDAKKMGGPDQAGRFRQELLHDIEATYKYFLRLNTNKFVYNCWKTPSMLFLLIAISLFSQYALNFIDFIGHDFLSSVFYCTTTVLLGLLGIWFVTIWNDRLRWAQEWIDGMMNFIYHAVIVPIIKNVLIMFLMR